MSQTTTGKVLMHFAVSVDGFVAGPGHDMSFMEKATVREGLHREYIESTGAVLAGRDGFDSAIGDSRPYGGAWQGPIFVLTHHPEDARSRSCHVRSTKQYESRSTPPRARTSRCSRPPSARNCCDWG